MIKSRNLVDSFSSFLICQSTFQQARWQTERILFKNMESVKASDPHHAKDHWALYWFKQWQQAESMPSASNSPQQTLPFRHLFAYLQEPAGMVAQKFSRTAGSTFKDYEACDFLNVTLLKVPSVLRHYQGELGHPLAAYAMSSFRRSLLDEARRICASAGDTDWGLLARTSSKRLRESLLQMIPREQLDDYLQVIDCYKEWAVPTHPSGRRNFKEPTMADYEDMAIAYQRYAPQRSPTQPQPITATTVKECLETSIRAIRLFTKPQVESLNQHLGNDSDLEWIDLTSVDSLSIEDLAQAEALQQVNQALTQAIESILNPAPQKTLKQQQKVEEMARILPLLYGDLVSQAEVGKKLQLQQATISRRLSEAKKHLWQELLNAFAPAQSPKEFKNYSQFLDAWLYQYFASFHIAQDTDNHDSL